MKSLKTVSYFVVVFIKILPQNKASSRYKISEVCTNDLTIKGPANRKDFKV